MTAPGTFAARRIGAMPWLAVAGPRTACFQALGEHAAPFIRAIVEELPQLEALRRQIATPAGRTRFDDVVEATATRFPAQMDELAALAAGAGVDRRTVLLLNCRGDLGDQAAGGCSDVSVPGERWVLGHNEDGDERFAGGMCGVTLAVDGERPVFALWYPGMLASNAFALNAGLAWGIDHVPAVRSTMGPARHVVARALHQVSDLDAASRLLSSGPSAGCFAYNFAERATGRVATVEAGGGAGGRGTGHGASPMLWHTNHLRYGGTAEQTHGAARSVQGDAGATDAPGPSSCARGDVLSRIVTTRGPTEPLSADEVLGVLTTALPDGVRAEGTSVTLCTVVVDGAGDEVTFVPRGGEPACVAYCELLA